ncbi:MAG: helix-turn-helix transcriptional regulator [Oscillospiraceae bacterium]
MLRNRIRELRARDRLTQDDLAKRVGVSRQTIVSLEKESYVPSLILAMHIAQQFGTTVEEIFYEENAI